MPGITFERQASETAALRTKGQFTPKAPWYRLIGGKGIKRGRGGVDIDAAPSPFAGRSISHFLNAAMAFAGLNSVIQILAV